MSSLKRVLLSITHLGSGSLPLLGLLNRNPRVQLLQTNTTVHSYPDLRAITSQRHKLGSSAAMFAIDLNYNYQLGPRVQLPHAHHLFVVRPPEVVLNLLVSKGFFKQEQAARYYCFRLRRMCEIAKRVGTGMLLTYDDIQRGDYTETLGEFLGLKEPVVHVPKLFDHLNYTENVFAKPTMDWCRDCYERHLFFMKSLPLVTVSRG